MYIYLILLYLSDFNKYEPFYLSTSNRWFNALSVSVSQAEQQKQATVISAEGDSQAALLIADSLAVAGDGLVELRKLEAAEDIAFQLSRSRNVTYLPSGQGTLLQLPQWSGN